MMFAGGQLHKGNIHLEDNDFEFYRLIGEAYQSHALDRQKVAQSKIKLLKNGMRFQDSIHAKTDSNDTQAPDTFYTYMIKGVPSTLSHNNQIDLKYGYSK